MGKQTSEQEYRLATARLTNCVITDCRSRTHKESDNFCSGCKSSYRVKKDYERTHASQIGTASGHRR